MRRSRPASARGVSRRDSIAARRTGTLAAAGRWPGPGRPAAAGRRRARAAGDPAAAPMPSVSAASRVPPIDLLARRASHLQAKRQVLPHRHVRVEGVVLKHHGDVAFARLKLIHPTLANANLARADLLEPRKHAERRALAAARRSDQDDELAVGDLEIRDPARRGIRRRRAC